MKVILTEHAIERARQRLGWRPATTRRMIARVADRGLGIKRTRGALRRYLEQKRAPGVALWTYGEHVFVFRWEETTRSLYLVTVWQLPLPLRPALRRAFAQAAA